MAGNTAVTFEQLWQYEHEQACFDRFDAAANKKYAQHSFVRNFYFILFMDVEYSRNKTVIHTHIHSTHVGSEFDRVIDFYCNGVSLATI